MSNTNLTTGAGNGPNPNSPNNYGPANPGSFTPPQPGGGPAQITASVTLASGDTVTGVQNADGGEVVARNDLVTANDLPLSGFGSVTPFGGGARSAGFGDGDLTTAPPDATNCFRANTSTAVYVSEMVSAAHEQQGSPAINAPIPFNGGIPASSVQTYRWE